MTTAIDKLIEISSNPLSPRPPCLFNGSISGIDNSLVMSLKSLLVKKNGFLAFESALHVLPAVRQGVAIELNSWNDKNGWRRNYSTGGHALLFFAQDLFANQFAVSEKGVLRLDSETGVLESHTENIALWAERILDDFNYETGWELAHEWQSQNFPIRDTHRLLPKLPFVLGGEFSVDNLAAVESRKAMDKLGHLCQTIQDVPDGDRITVENWLD